MRPLDEGPQLDLIWQRLNDTPANADRAPEEAIARNREISKRHGIINPARARRVGRAWDWPHSSVKRASGRPRRRARLACSRSSTARRASPIFSTWDADDPAFAALRRSELIGRPLGDEAFLDAISRRLNRVVTPRKPGRKPKGDVAGAEAKG